MLKGFSKTISAVCYNIEAKFEEKFVEISPVALLMSESFTSLAAFTAQVSRAASSWLTVSKIFVRSQVFLTFLATISFVTRGSFSKIRVAISVLWVLVLISSDDRLRIFDWYHHKIFLRRECHCFLPSGVWLKRSYELILLSDYFHVDVLVISVHFHSCRLFVNRKRSKIIEFFTFVNKIIELWITAVNES